jgi:hypothetical protein
MLVAGNWQRRGAGLKIFLIALFGAMGTLVRYGLQGVVQLRMRSGFPYGTLLINLSGCFLLGLTAQLTLNRMLISADMRMAIAGIFRRLHHVFQLRVGNRENAGSWRMVSRRLRCGQRSCRIVAVGRGNPSGEPILRPLFRSLQRRRVL